MSTTAQPNIEAVVEPSHRDDGSTINDAATAAPGGHSPPGGSLPPDGVLPPQQAPCAEPVARVDPDYVIDERGRKSAHRFQLVIAGGTLTGGVFQALQLGHGDLVLIVLMTTAAVMLAAVEIGIIQAAISARTNPSQGMRVFGYSLVGSGATITFVGVVVVLSAMWTGRQVDVVEANNQRIKAESTVNAADQRIAQKNDEVAKAQSAFDEAGKSATLLGSGVVKLPDEKCNWVTKWRNNGKPYKERVCQPDARTTAGLSDDQAARDRVNSARDALQKKQEERDKLLADLAPPKLAEDLANAQANYRRQVLLSPIHSFTGMAFGEASTAATDAQINVVLLCFCLLGAIPTAVFAPGLALLSVHRRPMQPGLPLHALVRTYGQQPAGYRQPRMVVVNGLPAQLGYWLANRNRVANVSMSAKGEARASSNVVDFDKTVMS